MRKLGTLVFALLLPACGGDPGTPAATTSPGTASCSMLGQVSFVRDTMQDIYFWYRELPALDPAGFSSPEAYLEAVRYRPLDASFSYINSREADQAFFSESQFVGLGLSSLQTGPEQIRIAQVFPGSPAAEAGLERGDFLLAINGRAVPDLIRTGEIGTVFGPAEVGVTVGLQWRNTQGTVFQATLAKRAVTIPTVSDTRVVRIGGRRAGYLHFRNFVQPSVAALDAAFTELAAEGADEVVLDLRYNGGGLVSVAQHLGGLIGGALTSGQVFAEFFHNDKNARRNSVLRFEDPAASLDLPRIVVITTGSSASASEAVINSLRPFLPVVVVGDATFGKPVGQYGFDFCDKVLYPVAFQVRNALGEGDYFGGIPADCAAADDLDHPLGDAGEASFQEALHYLRRGECGAGASAAARANARRRAATRPLWTDGWQQLLNAQ